jgi:hypothetical protein
MNLALGVFLALRGGARGCGSYYLREFVTLTFGWVDRLHMAYLSVPIQGLMKHVLLKGLMLSSR